MTDAPWTETHRKTLETWATPGRRRHPALEPAIRAALAEIDRLTAENDRLTHSLRDVRERKDQRINELVQQLTTAREERHAP